MKRVWTVLATMGCFTAQMLWADETNAVRGLIGRILPGYEARFVVETIPAADGKDVFEVAPGGCGKIVIRGNNALSQCVAFNHYLKYTAQVHVSWYADSPVAQMAELPPVLERVRCTTKLKDRFFLNYCTFGYTMPWWKWREWERLVDWMALNGINMPLAQGGNEAVWQRVWRSYGLTDDEIRQYFTGPAHLPWNRMANIDKWAGPLPQSYIDGQFALTRQIVERERSLGMRPILPAFAGHVPAALKRVRPNLKVTRLAPWPGMSLEHSVSFIDPKDPLFREIQVKFLKEQEAMLGTDHLYGTDPFNEMAPPSWEPSYLGSVSGAIYGSMAEADPQAVWVQMAWTFGSRENWTDPRLKAMIEAVPRGKMVLLDYAWDVVPVHPLTQHFFGAPVIGCYLGNFGGNTHIGAPINKINNLLTDALHDATFTNFVGVGATLEGLNNQFMYDFLFEFPWAEMNIDMAAWFRNTARVHTGGEDPAVEAAWEIMRTKVLMDDACPAGGHGMFFQSVPRLVTNARRGWVDPTQPYSNSALVAVWGKLLEAGPKARSRDAYQTDLADVTRQALGNAGDVLRAKMLEAYERKDAAAFRPHAARFKEMGNDIDGFLSMRPEFLLGKWIEGARAWGKDAVEADFYERNSRTILSTWVARDSNLTDYASRCWNGMIGTYYMPRWQMYLDTIAADLDAGRATDFPALENRMKDFEWGWAQGTGGKFPSIPQGDVFKQSKGLYEKYSDILR